MPTRGTAPAMLTATLIILGGAVLWQAASRGAAAGTTARSRHIATAATARSSAWTAFSIGTEPGHGSNISASRRTSPYATPTVAAPRPVRTIPGPPSIALTFDDGPYPYYTEEVLATLKRFGIHATFFVIGRQAAAYPDLVRKEAAQGEEVENHTWNHADLAILSAGAADQEIAETAAEVLLLTGRAPRYMRPPYGHTNYLVRADAAIMGEDTVLWNVDPRDWARPGAWSIQYNVLHYARDRSVVIMHDGGGLRDETVAALQAIIPALKARGFRFVTIQQLLDPIAPALLSPLHLPAAGNGQGSGL